MSAAPKQASNTRQLLRLSVAGEVLLVPIEAVHEILEVTRMTRVPKSPPFLRGVMNLRGAVVPVVDLAARFGFQPAVLARRSAIVVVEAHGEEAQQSLVAGLLVDAVYEVLDFPQDRLESVPNLGIAIPAGFVAGMVNLPSGYGALLSLEQVLAPAALAALIEAAA
jgi:purine-binding chemotaxis protein CheW